MNSAQQTAQEKRQDPRTNLYSTVLMATETRAWLTLVQDISNGGVRVSKPLDWQNPGYQPITLYFIFDQDTVVRLRASLVRDAPDHVGLAFKAGQTDEIGRVLYESRFAEHV